MQVGWQEWEGPRPAGQSLGKPRERASTVGGAGLLGPPFSPKVVRVKDVYAVCHRAPEVVNNMKSPIWVQGKPVYICGLLGALKPGPCQPWQLLWGLNTLHRRFWTVCTSYLAKSSPAPTALTLAIPKPERPFGHSQTFQLTRPFLAR